MTTRLYEDNAGQLTVTHEEKVYRDLERLEDGTTFSDFGRILQGIAIGDAGRFESELPFTEEHEELVVTWTPTGGMKIAGQLGLAARRFVGEEGECHV